MVFESVYYGKLVVLAQFLSRGVLSKLWLTVSNLRRSWAGKGAEHGKGMDFVQRRGSAPAIPSGAGKGAEQGKGMDFVQRSA